MRQSRFSRLSSKRQIQYVINITGLSFRRSFKTLSPNYAWIISFKKKRSNFLIEYFNALRGADFVNFNVYKFETKTILQAWEKSKKPIPPVAFFSSRCNAPWKQQFRAKPLLPSSCRVQLARFTTCRTLKNPSLSKYRTFSPVEFSLSGSKLFTTAAVYARLDIYLQRERNGAAVSETGSSQVEIKRRSETNFILRTEERSVQVLVTPASWESCRETRLLFRLVLPFAYFPLPLENDEPSFNTM